MRKSWRLTRIAETSLADIARWTAGTFGPRQAAAYEEDLIAICRGIAEGTVVSQGCGRLVDPDLPEDLRFARAGQHFVVFVEEAGQVVITDFLHGRSDLPRRLAALPARERAGRQ